MKRQRIFLYWLLIMLIMPGWGCTSAKLNTKRMDPLPVEKLQIKGDGPADDKIAFLTIRITLEDSLQERYRFNVSNTILAKGQLKKNTTNEFPAEPNYLYCEILNADKKRTDYIRVENPLLKVYEFNEAPGSPLQKKVVTGTSGEFYLRFQFDSNSKYLSIYKTSPGYKTLKKNLLCSNLTFIKMV